MLKWLTPWTMLRTPADTSWNVEMVGINYEVKEKKGKLIRGYIRLQRIKGHFKCQGFCSDLPFQTLMRTKGTCVGREGLRNMASVGVSVEQEFTGACAFSLGLPIHCPDHQASFIKAGVTEHCLCDHVNSTTRTSSWPSLLEADSLYKSFKHDH